MQPNLEYQKPGLRGLPVLIRGAGEMASGVAHRLFRAGFNAVMTEAASPLAVRRAVSFCEAVHEGFKTVEGVTARLVEDVENVPEIWRQGEIPVLVDPQMRCLADLKPPVVVDALLAKKNTGLRRDMALLTIGLGPGFLAPDEVHLAIETNRGHNLGRLIYQGSPEPNTGVPGDIAGQGLKRVLRAPADGRFETVCQLGDRVAKDQVVAMVAGLPVTSQLDGILRGLIRPGTLVHAGLKVGDVDPRGNIAHLNTISEKARAIGGAVLEGIMAAFNR
jgi:xanthine dehydrogenase accessory factor